ncbi:MAG TPA: isoleucine--tRNA ligase [Nanoarchaeota archaeon]|nr:isoleucine--tRNA ligase [Nanoarchaeota archaeon]
MQAGHNPVAFEKEILDFWSKKKIYDKQKKLYKNSKKRWSFIDGPITTNNPMGVHHAWGRTLKDLYLRWHAMQGYEIRRQNGFDTQGLWIEREVEKELGFKRGKKDIEEYGIGKFVDKCKERVVKMAARQTEQSIRLGQWMDWDDSYYTGTDKANEYKWFFLKFCHEKGWIYKGKDVIPWCPRCSTAESKHAIATEGYFEIEHNSMFMQFPVHGKEGEYFLVWTTTPWTVPADVAIAVNPEINYVKIRQKDKHYWLAESRRSILKGEYEIEEKVSGKKLLGLKYEMPYKDLEAQKGAAHKVVSWDCVSGEDGTGIVHIAPGCGPEDYALGKVENLTSPSPLDEEGIFISGFGGFTGSPVNDINLDVIVDLEKRGFIYKIEKIKHRYPHCTRCSTPLVFRLVDEWYIAVNDMREKLIEENRKIRWVPEQGQKYEENWLTNMSDWLISRKRYYGLPLPIWECACGHFEVIGSVKELKKKAVSGFSKMKELHRPWVDEVKIKCQKCGQQASRIPDTGDVWLDAGMVPFFTLNYLEDKKYFDKWYPADLVTECGPGQYRCWFYSMILHGVFLTGKAPFKSIMTNETVKAEDGREMHKSWGNAIWFDDAADKVGADVMRWTYCTHDISRELLFGWRGLEEQRKNLNVLWNLGIYLKTYLGEDFKPAQFKTVSITDRWILSRLESLKKKVNDNLDALQPHLAAVELQKFFLNDFSRSYIHFVRDVLVEEGKPKENTLQIIHSIMLELLTLLAPFIPFTSEKIYLDVFKQFSKPESIHLFGWPEVNEKLIDEKLESDMEAVEKIISELMSGREKMQRGVKWQISKAVIIGDENLAGIIETYSELISNQTNIIEFTVQKDDPKGVNTVAKADYNKINAKFGRNSAEVIARIVQISAESILAKIQKVGKYEFKLSNEESAEIVKEDLAIQKAVPAELFLHEAGNIIYFEKPETKEMLASGFARELTRGIQDLRKKAGLQKADRISLAVACESGLKDALAGELGKFKDKLGAPKIEFVKPADLAKKKNRNSLKIRQKDFEFGF